MKYFNLYQAKQFDNAHKFERISLMKPDDLIDPKHYKKRCLLICLKRIPHRNKVELKVTSTFVEVASIQNFNEVQTMQEKKVVTDVKPISMMSSGSSTQILFPLGKHMAGYITSPARNAFGKELPQNRSKRKGERRKALRSVTQRKQSTSSIFEVTNYSSSTVIHHRSVDEIDGSSKTTTTSQQSSSDGRSRNFTHRLRQKLFGGHRHQPRANTEESSNPTDSHKEIVVDTIENILPSSRLQRQRSFCGGKDQRSKSFRQQQHPRSRYSTGLLFS